MEQAATYMGIGIAALRHVLDPEVVVLGGGVAEHAFHRLFPTLYRAARRHAIGPDKGAVPVVPSMLGDDAGLIGAAALAWEEGERG
jgi:glucokinase